MPVTPDSSSAASLTDTASSLPGIVTSEPLLPESEVYSSSDDPESLPEPVLVSSVGSWSGMSRSSVS